MDWAVFWAATTAASTLATAIATSTVLWLNKRHRPEADWSAELSFMPTVVRQYNESEPNPLAGKGEMRCRLYNVGDGLAFRVAARGSGCLVDLRRFLAPSETFPTSVQKVPVLEPGDAAFINVWSDLGAWGTAEVVIEWTRSPTRLRKRVSTRIPLREIAPVPEST
jgi:hypothetical protein